MIRFLQPEWLWLLTLLPLVMLWRGRRGPVAAVEYLGRESGAARSRARSRSRIGRLGVAAADPRGALHDRRARPAATRATAAPKSPPTASTSCWDWTCPDPCRRSIFRSTTGASIASTWSSPWSRNSSTSGPTIASASSPSPARPTWSVPLTLDHDWLQQNLERVSTGVGADDGTAIGSAIAAGVNHLRTTAAKSKVVILLTDGMNNTGKISPLAAAEAAKALGVKVYTIGVGVRGMAPIPVRDEAGNMHMIMDKVDVDEKTLQAVAAETGGTFYRATDTDSLQKIYEQINRLEKSAQTVQKFEHYDELYPWALIPALGILGLGLLLQHTRFRRLP